MDIKQKFMKKILLFSLVLYVFATSFSASAQHTVARLWNEVLLEGIRNDYARPTVHARNLFHISAAMYDCWSVYDQQSVNYFLGRNIGGFKVDFEGVSLPLNIEEAQKEALSYACYRLITHRFKDSPGSVETKALADNLMATLGYDTNEESQDYTSGSPAALGNYLAAKIIEFGLQDGSNEADGYQNLFYQPANAPMIVAKPGGQDISDPNRWQPLAFDVFIDQAGNEIPGEIPAFLSPEWGNTVPFALTEQDEITYERDGASYKVYHDPGAPAYINPDDHAASDDYKWGFGLVSVWSSHLDPSDGVTWDISPNTIGNLKISDFPTTVTGLKEFYNLMEGGDPGTGYSSNPKTGQPYPTQLVNRGDYARVLAEFWADGPDSETPPGHWFTILNYVNDHPELMKKFKGEGDVMNDLEWDVKGYFTLGGAMHDAAISAWGIKGYYDYIRPISAIRYMADQGQASDPAKMNYNESGIPLIEGYIELIESGDPLAGMMNENIGKIKLLTWRGPDYITDPEIDEAGVGWILAENWWPYQRPTFVTPPFAGYVSGHSTYSRAAAEVLTLFTGDEYFPGGLGEFIAPKNEFLVFEEGPSEDVVLQWAKYYDASDQCSLSRIWGGIHPPVDDIPGRLIGEKVGNRAFEHAEKFFNGTIVGVERESESVFTLYPNPASDGSVIYLSNLDPSRVKEVHLVGSGGQNISLSYQFKSRQSSNSVEIKLPYLSKGIYVLKLLLDNGTLSKRVSILD